MAKPSKDSQEKVSLEELLRFKKSERPDETFWSEFDQQLHQRMMRTLVKKEPWPVQVMRALSGKLAQTTAIGAAAAVLAMMVIRPAFLASNDGVQATELAGVAVEEAQQVVAAQIDSTDLDPALLASADYAIEVYTVDEVGGTAGVTREFSHDRLAMASYEDEVYRADSALSAFTSPGVASLVF